MPRITAIKYAEGSQRYQIFVDGNYCTSVRERTFPALGIGLGQEIGCEQIKDLESYHWKKTYGEKNAWQKEKVRISRVKGIIEKRFSDIKVEVEGFGADSNEFIPEHPDEPGKPDLGVFGRTSGKRYCSLEVSGTETRRGEDYWVRPDKLRYAQSHPEENVWICLHYANPSEQLVFIKPDMSRDYQVTPKNIGDATEHYVSFHDDSAETMSLEDFFDFLLEQRPFGNLATNQ